ncbi:MAG: DUF2764 domain-containing protein [Bacteroidaceae bacterium]|nr:DUF2764 domain-containing protein [Bacteroidaceae bacterium]
MANYYCMMAGAADISLADAKAAVSFADFKAECEENLTPGDKQLLFYFYLRWDCMNIVRLLKAEDKQEKGEARFSSAEQEQGRTMPGNPEAELEMIGNYNRDQYADMITSARELTFNVHRYPAFMSIFIREYNYNKEKPDFCAEDAMMFQYLTYCIAQCRNRMMKDWYRLNLNLDNILTALIARRYGWNVARYIQGDDEVTEMIRTNNSKDFDLSLEYDYVKDLMRIVEEPDPVRKEHGIDAFKWLWLDEQTFFDPFSIEAVFAYLCKLAMLRRWEKLDPQQGRETFEHIINDLRGEAKVPAEFVRK